MNEVSKDPYGNEERGGGGVNKGKSPLLFENELWLLCRMVPI